MGMILASAALASLCVSAPAQVILLEAEGFEELGGWSIDTATTLSVGSPYLLAHGLGRPVEDARTTFDVPRAATYRLWARTRDWVAPWGAPGSPGRFQVLVDGVALETEFGTRSPAWHWQPGGELELEAGEHRLSLHDLTGFDGRCDALFLAAGPQRDPPVGDELQAARRDCLDLAGGTEDVRGHDLVVVGGGYAGIAAALSAARQSLRVALVQDRDVLGGNGSSEVRVWANGGTLRGLFPRLGEIVEEFGDHAPDSPGDGVHFGDARKQAICEREPNLDLYLGHFAGGVTTDPETGAIRSVEALEVRTGRERRFHAPLFVDCTGHGTIGALAGADYEVKPEGRMGMSNMWTWREVPAQEGAAPVPWPETPWALDLESGDFPGTPRSRSRIDGAPFFKGEWFWESGFDLDPIEDLERIRDWNLRAVFGAFGAIHAANPRAELLWVAHVGGTRESRLLRGDVVLTAEHIVERQAFPDGCVPTTWDIDLHYPKQQYAAKYPDNPFISRAEFGAGVDRDEGYPVPYRCLYSRNVPNLFMAGRCISVTHEALGTVRVMRTCGMMGEVVGRAAYLCRRYGLAPRGVYEERLEELLELQRQPGAMRRESLGAELELDESIAAVRPYRTKGDDAVDGLAPDPALGVPLDSLAGIVVDDSQAELRGTWSAGGLSDFVGAGYRYADAGSQASARYGIEVREAGPYELRLAWVPHENRGRRVLCTLEREGQPALKLRIDQRSPGGEELFHVLGTFDFPAGGSSVTLSAADADGCVHADALQLVRAR